MGNAVDGIGSWVGCRNRHDVSENVGRFEVSTVPYTSILRNSKKLPPVSVELVGRLLRFESPADGVVANTVTASGVVQFYYNRLRSTAASNPGADHPRVPPGTIHRVGREPADSDQSNEVPNVAEIKDPADYYQIDWRSLPASARLASTRGNARRSTRPSQWASSANRKRLS